MSEPAFSDSEVQERFDWQEWQKMAAELYRYAPCGGYCEDPGSHVHVFNLTEIA